MPRHVLILPPKGIPTLEEMGWCTFSSVLQDLGLSVTYDASTIDSSSWIISFNNYRDRRRLLDSVAPSRRIGIVLEPRVTSPYTHRTVLEGDFSVVFAGSPMWFPGTRVSVFRWPQAISGDRIPIAQQYPYDVTALSGDKYSAIPGSLYGLRRRIGREFDRQGIRLAMFGRGWSDPPIRRWGRAARACVKSAQEYIPPDLALAAQAMNWRPRRHLGVASTKRQALSFAPASLVIENSADYVSEKLFDVLVHGVVPLYVGPPLEQFGIPGSLVVQCGMDPQHVVETVMGLDTELLESLRTRASVWLASEAAEVHAAELVVGGLARDVWLHISSN
jgi:hypothetical protein